MATDMPVQKLHAKNALIKSNGNSVSSYASEFSNVSFLEITLRKEFILKILRYLKRDKKT